MDKVLLRPMFRKRYLEEYKISTFKKGGIASIPKFNQGGMSSDQKAILAATFAAPLLQSKTLPGQTNLQATLSSLGEGLALAPTAMLKFKEIEAKKAKGGKGLRSATDQEKADLGYNVKDRLIVKIEDGEVVGIADKPTMGEREKAADRQATLKQADKILTNVQKFNTGPIAGKMQRFGIAVGVNPAAAEFNVQLEEFKKSAIKALRGAQVGPLEEASFSGLLPTIDDPENVIQAKVKVMKEKLEEIDSRLGAGGVVTDPGNFSYYIDAYEKFGIDPSQIGEYDASLPTYKIQEGELVEVQ
tara:strand:+ start:118 stop:1020 length:903 start_codon:yes stop_codon:yes gene_type:complete